MWKEELQTIKGQIEHLKQQRDNLIGNNQSSCNHPEFARVFVDEGKYQNAFGLCRECGYAEESGAGRVSETFGYLPTLPEVSNEYAKNFIIGGINRNNE